MKNNLELARLGTVGSMTIKVLHEGDLCVHRIVLHPDCGDSYINIHM